MLSRRPRAPSVNETSTVPRPVGSGRSTQVSPRSDERKRRVPATSAHTTVPDGALSCAMLGSVMGVGATVGEGDAVADGVALADGGAVVALDAGGGAAQ